MKSILNILKKVAIVLVVLIALGAIFGGGGKSSDKVSSSSGSDQGKVSVEKTEAESDTTMEEVAKEEAPKEKYTITDEELDTSNPYSAVIRGILTNNTDRDYGYLQVEYILYDADGNQIGSALANVNNLKAGGSWKFEAVTLKSPDEIAAFELADVTGF